MGTAICNFESGINPGDFLDLRLGLTVAAKACGSELTMTEQPESWELDIVPPTDTVRTTAIVAAMVVDTSWREAHH